MVSFPELSHTPGRVCTADVDDARGAKGNQRWQSMERVVSLSLLIFGFPYMSPLVYFEWATGLDDVALTSLGVHEGWWM